MSRSSGLRVGIFGVCLLVPFTSMAEPGTVMYEMDGVGEDEAREAFRLAMHKLPIKTRVVKKGMVVA